MKFIHLFFTLLLVPLAGCDQIVKGMAVDFEKDPSAIWGPGHEKSATLLEKAFDGLEETGVVDHHLHVVGRGFNPKAMAAICPDLPLTHAPLYINEKRFHLTNPKWFVMTKALMAGLDVTDRCEEAALPFGDGPQEDSCAINGQYAARLLELVKGLRAHPDDNPGRIHLLAYDAIYNKRGDFATPSTSAGPDWQKTDIYVPNDYVTVLARCLNTQFGRHAPFVPVGSVHPYNSRWADAIDQLADEGVKYLKLLPNSMAFDPDDPDLVPYYRKVAERNMIILAHTAHEDAIVPIEGFQQFGSPLVWKRALDEGAKVQLSHAGYLGATCRKGSVKGEWTKDHFFEMMANEKYRGLLFADLSAVTLFIFPEWSTYKSGDNLDPAMRCDNRPEGTQAAAQIDLLKKLLESEELSCRVVSGSDYPLPAISLLNPTSYLFQYGFISRKEKVALDEIYRFNPMLFDFALKRSMRSTSGGLSHRFEDRMFKTVDDLLADPTCARWNQATADGRSGAGRLLHGEAMDRPLAGHQVDGVNTDDGSPLEKL